jgi:hypothetical protein
MLKNILKRKTKEQKFWDWFSSRSDQYLDFEKNQDRLFDNLKLQLNKINGDLTFEFGPVSSNHRREFVISADGIKKSFPDVINLVNSAPVLDHFEIVAFRQPHLGFTQISFKDIQIDLKDVFFRYGKDNGKIGIELNIRNYQENNDWGAAAFILLDNILGEYDTEMNLSWIERKKLDELEILKLLPITDLPTVMANYKKEIQN